MIEARLRHLYNQLLFYMIVWIVFLSLALFSVVYTLWLPAIGAGIISFLMIAKAIRIKASINYAHALERKPDASSGSNIR